jgi:hypothetical protein
MCGLRSLRRCSVNVRRIRDYWTSSHRSTYHPSQRCANQASGSPLPAEYEAEDEYYGWAATNMARCLFWLMLCSFRVFTTCRDLASGFLPTADVQNPHVATADGPQ